MSRSSGPGSFAGGGAVGAGRLGAAGPASSRRRARFIGAAVLALPVIELLLLVALGRVIGVLGVLMVLLAGAVIGTVVLRRVGSAAARRVAAAAAGTTPVPPPAGSGLLVPAAFLLIVPGLLTDAVGLALLVPAVRRVVAVRAGEAAVRRLGASGIRFGPGAFGPGAFGPGAFGPGPFGSGPFGGSPVEVRVHDAPPTEPGRSAASPATSQSDPLAIEPPTPPPAADSR